jgi:glycosyltransferase involved in cell wall biosynthesis
MDVPVGNRSRILTALSAGAVLIAHKNVSLGNPDLISGVNCLLASDVESFVDAMKHSVNEPSVMKQIANNGRQMYIDRFSIESAAPLFANFFRSSFSHS